MDGNFELNYLRFLEGRILTIIYRLNIRLDIFNLLKFIRIKNNIFIDFKPIYTPNFLVPIGKLITIHKK